MLREGFFFFDRVVILAVVRGLERRNEKHPPREPQGLQRRRHHTAHLEKSEGTQCED